MKAVVLGSTGAVGRELVASLARQAHITTVLAVTRSGPSSPSDVRRWIGEKFPSLTEPSHTSKVEAVELDWEDFAERELSGAKRDAADECPSNPFAGADYVGWALGTTKADAGSAEAFERVDFDYCRAAASVARREPSVKHFAVLSSAGASSKSWFLYLKTKGRIENFVTGLGFDRVSVYRPGLLDRGDKLRSKERILGKFLKATSASAVADLMASHSNHDEGEGRVEVYETF
mmetsp:Transcript_6906/g.14383  ORF Transcript_6906/g.14383 Transcript_6906/m.14383 type:complete len:233 (-) Transcript_6906:228-926(-)